MSSLNIKLIIIAIPFGLIGLAGLLAVFFKLKEKAKKLRGTYEPKTESKEDILNDKISELLSAIEWDEISYLEVVKKLNELPDNCMDTQYIAGSLASINFKTPFFGDEDDTNAYISIQTENGITKEYMANSYRVSDLKKVNRDTEFKGKHVDLVCIKEKGQKKEYVACQVII